METEREPHNSILAQNLGNLQYSKKNCVSIIHFECGIIFFKTINYFCGRKLLEDPGATFRFDPTIDTICCNRSF